MKSHVISVAVLPPGIALKSSETMSLCFHLHRQTAPISGWRQDRLKRKQFLLAATSSPCDPMWTSEFLLGSYLPPAFHANCIAAITAHGERQVKSLEKFHRYTQLHSLSKILVQPPSLFVFQRTLEIIQHDSSWPCRRTHDVKLCQKQERFFFPFSPLRVILHGKSGKSLKDHKPSSAVQIGTAQLVESCHEPKLMTLSFCRLVFKIVWHVFELNWLYCAAVLPHTS